MCAGEQIASRGIEIMVAQMKAPENWFRHQRLNPHGDESWNEIAINSLMRLRALLQRRRVRTNFRRMVKERLNPNTSSINLPKERIPP